MILPEAWTARKFSTCMASAYRNSCQACPASQSPLGVLSEAHLLRCKDHSDQSAVPYSHHDSDVAVVRAAKSSLSASKLLLSASSCNHHEATPRNAASHDDRYPPLFVTSAVTPAEPKGAGPKCRSKNKQENAQTLEKKIQLRTSDWSFE